jgi:hypothetical protein
MQREERAPEPAAAEPAIAPGASAPGMAFSPTARILALQRTAGNRAVRQMLSRAEYASDSGLNQGDWTEEDRKKKTDRWKKACEYNLLRGANSEYTQVAQRRDFYWWFYDAIVAKGGETRWPLAAAIVASGANEVTTLSSTSEGVLGKDINEVQGMMREGNQVIFDNVFPKLKGIYVTPLKGKAAVDWDVKTLAEEQNLVQLLYAGVSKGAVAILTDIATGSTLTKVGAAVSDASEVKPGAGITPGKVPFFTGNLLDVADRWRYGMKLASTFSSITPTEGGAPVAVPSAPPGVDPGYTSGAELRAVDTRRNIHFFDAITDSTLNADEHKSAVNRLTLFTPAEQKYFLDRAEYYRVRIDNCGMFSKEVLRGMSGWSTNLGFQLIFVHKLRSHGWTGVDYAEVKPMIKACASTKSAINGAFWRKIFIDICNDGNITEAVDDLGLAEPERSEWIKEEKAIF